MTRHAATHTTGHRRRLRYYRDESATSGGHEPYDAAAVVGSYASDAWLFAPNEELIKGQAGILKWWQNALSGPPATAKLMSEEVQSCGETAWETGRYSITATDGKVLDKGKYVTIWKRDGSTWKLYRDIFNTDVPAPR